MTPEDIKDQHSRLIAARYSPTEGVPIGTGAPPPVGVVLEFGSPGHERFLEVGAVECLERGRLRVTDPDWLSGRQDAACTPVGKRSTFGPGFVCRRVWARP